MELVCDDQISALPDDWYFSRDTGLAAVNIWAANICLRVWEAVLIMSAVFMSIRT